MNTYSANLFNIIAFLIDNNENESISTIVNEIDNEKVVSFIINKYKQKYPKIQAFKNFEPNIIQELELFFKDICKYIDVSEKDANSRGIHKNGLLYLLILINSKISSDLFDWESSI